MHALLESFLTDIFTALPGLVIRGLILIVLFIIWPKLLGMILTTYKKTLEKKNVDPLLESFTVSLLKTIAYIALFFVVVSVIGIKATSLVTVLGTAGIAVGLALQGSLSNLAGGVLILFFKQFSKGDYISNNGGIEGTVDQIHILYTTLITTDNKVIVVPNGQLANNAIINYSRKPERRLDMVFSVSYDTSTDKAKELLRQIAENHPAVLKDKAITIRMAKQNASSLDFNFRVWVKSSDYWDTLYDFNEEVKKVFDENGIEIPYQKIDIYNRTEK
ncbi:MULTISPECIES: mechanosensitive ion channel family protein [Fusobacterium]|uniref:mechanosensitive ion channel family protein n=1 Tax=Fusobacterium TaxID=848 RepID=UPI000BBB4CFD|nr:mechanosensitive ion channel domain-containing protein [Fusobacterium ulcerans]BBA52911.1 putative mechanosensitive ion channel protein [Fusobacterium varium]